MYIKSANVILTSMLVKIQATLNEQILFYQIMSNKIKNIDDINNLRIDQDKFRSVYDFDDDFYNKNKNILEYIGYWYINNSTKKFEDIDNIKTRKQIISFSYLMPNLFSAFDALSKSYSSLDYFFFFEETNLFISYPVLYDYTNDLLDSFYEFDENPYWCTDEEGKIYNIFFIKCREFYINIQKAKSNIFDINYLINNNTNNNRTIFVTNFYKQLNEKNEEFIYSICIQFLDPITNNKAFACLDVNQDDLIFAFDNINDHLEGYFFITCVGFNKVFYFPKLKEDSNTIAENIYKWNIKYFLKEKNYFILLMLKN